jgi:predicted ribosome quality control (RQC) complex YloA/Tae2 family protein
MSQDALTLAAIRDELCELLVGGRVQRVIRPTELSIGLEIYTGRRYQVLLSADPVSDGVALSDERLRRGVDNASPLQLLLRKYVDGSRLLEILQPPLERVLLWRFGGAEGTVVLICEIMGRLSNLVLVGDDGVVLDAARRVPARINRYRTTLPGGPYVPPPPQDRPAPQSLDARGWAAELAAQSGTLPRRLVQVARGISPLIAREITWRATASHDPALPLSDAGHENLVRAVQTLYRGLDDHRWEPSMGYQMQDGQRVAVAYAPYPLTHLDAWEPIASISRAALVPRGQARAHDPYAQVRADLRTLIAEQVSRQRARLEALERASVSEQELADLQFQGEAILAMAWAIAPGQQTLVVTRADVTGEEGPEAQREITIPLDTALSAADNAQAIFRAYRKRQAAGAQVPALIEESEQELAYLEQLLNDVNMAEDRPALDQVEAALHEAGYVSARPKRVSSAASGPLQVHTPEGALILVGRNSRQNEEVTFRLSAPQDLWLHAHGVPGAHVVLRSGGRAPDEEELLQAAALAAYYSSARDERQVQVDVTERRHVRRMPGGRPGMVTYRGERTLLVDPAGGEPG